MSNTQTILDALNATVTPNTSSQYAEDDFQQKQHRLMMLLEQRLAGEPATQDIIKKYLEDSSVWQSNLADAFVKAELDRDDVVLEAAEDVLRSIEPYEPERPDTGLPSSIPGVLADVE